MRASERTAAVGLVVPVYNRLELLEETVASLRAQTLENAQFVLVDDCSEDRVWRFLQDAASGDDRFRIIRKPPHIERGSQQSRNLGLDSVDAEGVMFLDSDDLLEPTCLEHRIAFLRANPDADIVIGHQAVMGRGSLAWVNVPRPDRAYLDRFLECAGQIDVPWVNGGVLMRLDRLRTHGVRWRPEFHWDDLVFHFECLLAGMRAVPMPAQRDADSYYRSHEEERFGKVLGTRAGIENAAAMFQWIARRLLASGQATPSRMLALRRSYFHFCVRQPLELGERDLARRLIELAEANRLISAHETRKMKAYARAFSVSGLSSRLSAPLVRLAGSGLLKDFFEERTSTFSVVPVN